MNKYNFQEAYLDESCFCKSSNLFQEINFPAWLQEQKALGKVQRNVPGVPDLLV